MEISKGPLKIAFVGTASVGKTTLLNKLRLKLVNNPKVAFIEEVARDFFKKEATPSKYRFSFEIQEKIQSIILEKEQKVHSKNFKLILCDRSVIDAIVYVKASGDKEGAKKIFEKIKFWLPTYHKFLLLDPSGYPYKNDSIRKESKGKRQKIHKAFLDFFRETGLPFEVVGGTLDERIKRVNQILKESWS